MSYQTAKEITMSDLKFLKLIFAEDWPRAIVQFKERTGFRGLAAGDWADALDTTVEETRYYCVSTFTGEAGVRRAEDFERQRVLILDDVGEKSTHSGAQIEAILGQPTFKMYTSLHSEQWGYYLDPADPLAANRGVLDHLIHAIVDNFFGGKDPGMVGVTRVVRTPNSFNMKEDRIAENGGSPPKAKLYEWNPIGFTVAGLCHRIGIDPADAEDTDASQGIPAEWSADAPVVKAIEDGRIQVFRSSNKEGELLVECPNRHQHTEDDDGHRSGKLYMKADGSGGFKCHHGSCEEFRFPHFLKAHGLLNEHEKWKKDNAWKAAAAEIPGAVVQEPAIDFMNFEPVEPVRAAGPDLTMRMPPGFDPAQAQAAEPAPTSSTVPEADGEPVWRRVINGLSLEQKADPAAIAYVVGLVAELPDVDRAMARNELKAELKGFMAAPDIDKAVKKARRAWAEELQAQRDMGKISGSSAGIDRYRAEPGAIVFPYVKVIGGEVFPENHPENLKALLDYHGIVARYNYMTHNIELSLDIPFLEDTRDENQLLAMEAIARVSGYTADGMARSLDYVAQSIENAYHPVVTAIEGMPAWDRVDRFNMLTKCIQTPHPERLSETLRHWMRQAIVAAFNLEPEVPKRDVLTFMGQQYSGKSTFFQILSMGIPNAFRGGVNLDPSNKDSVAKAISSWLVELGEVDATFRKSDIAHLKAHIAELEDVLRNPYARKASTYRRRTVYAATVNEREFLVDTTGNTRFKVVEVDSIDLDQLRILAAQGIIGMIWRQIHAEVIGGAPWYFSKERTAQLDSENDEYRKKDPIEAALLEELDFSIPLDRWEWRQSKDIWTYLKSKGHSLYLNKMAGGVRLAVRKVCPQEKPRVRQGRNQWYLPPFPRLPGA